MGAGILENLVSESCSTQDIPNLHTETTKAKTGIKRPVYPSDA